MLALKCTYVQLGRKQIVFGNQSRCIYKFNKKFCAFLFFKAPFDNLDLTAFFSLNIQEKLDANQGPINQNLFINLTFLKISIILIILIERNFKCQSRIFLNNASHKRIQLVYNLLRIMWINSRKGMFKDHFEEP